MGVEFGSGSRGIAWMVVFRNGSLGQSGRGIEWVERCGTERRYRVAVRYGKAVEESWGVNRSVKDSMAV